MSFEYLGSKKTSSNNYPKELIQTFLIPKKTTQGLILCQNLVNWLADNAHR
ncbi:hypothetical protein LDG_8841 [Legionella drancourtii LLAP12]|uniref:Uncharacterized protein n=1 Tax=Legionella drancourtii LLAP12 TaxID=658187 RepID=G9EU51_9GAMM|nr:hypothetical protein LDG_8841 [Legionella drancourtii LLAP12]